MIYSTKFSYRFLLDRVVVVVQGVAVTYCLNLQGNKGFAIYLEKFSQLDDGNSESLFRKAGIITYNIEQKLKR